MKAQVIRFKIIFLVFVFFITAYGLQDRGRKDNVKIEDNTDSTKSFTSMANMNDEPKPMKVGGWRVISLNDEIQFAHIDNYLRKKHSEIIEKRCHPIEISKQVVAGYNYKIIYECESNKKKYRAIAYEGIDQEISSIVFEAVKNSEDM